MPSSCDCSVVLSVSSVSTAICASTCRSSASLSAARSAASSASSCAARSVDSLLPGEPPPAAAAAAAASRLRWPPRRVRRWDDRGCDEGAAVGQQRLTSACASARICV
jgi:hypothetical protein